MLMNMKCFDSCETAPLKSSPTMQCHVGPYRSSHFFCKGRGCQHALAAGQGTCCRHLDEPRDDFVVFRADRIKGLLHDHLRVRPEQKYGHWQPSDGKRVRAFASALSLECSSMSETILVIPLADAIPPEDTRSTLLQRIQGERGDLILRSRAAPVFVSRNYRRV